MLYVGAFIIHPRLCLRLSCRRERIMLSFRSPTPSAHARTYGIIFHFEKLNHSQRLRSRHKTPTGLRPEQQRSRDKARGQARRIYKARPILSLGFGRNPASGQALRRVTPLICALHIRSRHTRGEGAKGR